MSTELPIWIDRCEPSRPCPQVAQCARAVADGEFRRRVDASGCIGPDGCGLFIDRRGVLLLQIERPARRARPDFPAQTQAQWFSPISQEAA